MSTRRVSIHPCSLVRAPTREQRDLAEDLCWLPSPNRTRETFTLLHGKSFTGASISFASDGRSPSSVRILTIHLRLVRPRTIPCSKTGEGTNAERETSDRSLVGGRCARIRARLVIRGTGAVFTSSPLIPVRSTSVTRYAGGHSLAEIYGRE